jgi:hypothetical protein
MPYVKTHTEIRNAEVNRALIEITEEMQSTMQVAFEADAERFAVDEKPRIDDRESNFRPYDQPDDLGLHDQPRRLHVPCSRLAIRSGSSEFVLFRIAASLAKSSSSRSMSCFQFR